MIYFIFLLFIYFVPTLWVKYTLGKHNGDLPNMPYTALEFGNELLKEKELNDVKIEDTNIGDHYDPNTKKVRVEPHRLDKKVLQALQLRVMKLVMLFKIRRITNLFIEDKLLSKKLDGYLK